MLPCEFSLRCTASHPKAKVASGNNVVHMGRSYSRAKPLPCESPASQCDFGVSVLNTESAASQSAHMLSTQQPVPLSVAMNAELHTGHKIQQVQDHL